MGVSFVECFMMHTCSAVYSRCKDYLKHGKMDVLAGFGHPYNLHNLRCVYCVYTCSTVYNRCKDYLWHCKMAVLAGVARPFIYTHTVYIS